MSRARDRESAPGAGLERLAVAGLRVESTRGAMAFWAAGQEQGRMERVQSPLRKALDPRFLRRALRLAVDRPELDTVWQVRVGGHRVVRVVHLFPQNVHLPEGTPAGRGFELRAPSGRVVAFTDQERGRLTPVLLVKDGRGEVRLRCAAERLRTRLVLRTGDGAERAVASRRVLGPADWRLEWLAPGLPVEARREVVAGLLLALLWTRA